eukprot:CAMPEP_0174386414 /NCGR_PEP_ID=MMETSP0811_2-20130205/127260_1 /TAXON_ID=73025 ORGANISM="Eutreptiella gymnastica-like, Strain CCMP1594" /NCGR_SAMPLE_ID=MMETSP0811_2 /ASSEMBLY_ACC=CAM_ASM_000667 /LENGTH=63 /DNA_ID=CAMNT_0015541081 /DNA_START=26 /DNA_END=217 /DNA_ORIENTATION=+
MELLKLGLFIGKGHYSALGIMCPQLWDRIFFVVQRAAVSRGAPQGDRQPILDLNRRDRHQAES